MQRTIKNPETDPDHHTIGKKFKAWDGGIYYCDSWEENAGYWMTPVDNNEAKRRNVSERAIGRTFHQVNL